MSWHDKVKEAIAEQCEESRKQARGNRKNHVSYRVPELAQAMVKSLDEDDEHEGKRLLLIYRTGALSLI